MFEEEQGAQWWRFNLDIWYDSDMFLLLVWKKGRTRRRSPLNLHRPLMKWSPSLKTAIPGLSVYLRVSSLIWTVYLVSFIGIDWSHVGPLQWPRCGSVFFSLTSSPQGHLSSIRDTNTSWWSARCAAGSVPFNTVKGWWIVFITSR